jgi:hypothetical protein
MAIAKNRVAVCGRIDYSSPDGQGGRIKRFNVYETLTSQSSYELFPAGIFPGILLIIFLPVI